MAATCNLKNRYRFFFRFIDVNKDKVLSRADVEALLVNIGRLYKADRKEMDVIHRDIDTWWQNMEPLTTGGKIKEDDYVEVMKNLFEKDPEIFRQRLHKSYDLLFNIVDRNQDNQISLAEFIKYYASYKVKDKATITKIFRQMDVDLDDFVKRDEWISAHVKYMTCDDPRFDHGFLYKVFK